MSSLYILGKILSFLNSYHKIFQYIRLNVLRTVANKDSPIPVLHGSTLRCSYIAGQWFLRPSKCHEIKFCNLYDNISLFQPQSCEFLHSANLFQGVFLSYLAVSKAGVASVFQSLASCFYQIVFLNVFSSPISSLITFVHVRF